MRLLNRHFFAGFFAGILFLVVMSVLAANIFVATRPGDPAEEMGALLAAPAYPPPAQTTVHGEADGGLPPLLGHMVQTLVRG